MTQGAQSADAIVIGGGHNGLVCAWYLANAGLKVVVCERRGVVGGAAVTEEFHPGFRNSVASYTVSLLNPRVIADMGLHDRGLTIVERPISNFLPIDDTTYLKLGGGQARTQEEFRKFSAKDAEVLPAYYAMLDRIGDVLRKLAAETPPNLGDGVPGLLRALRQGGLLAFLSREDKRNLLDLFTKSARDFLNGWFESEPVKAAFGFDAVVGNYASPDAPGSAYVLLHHTFGEVNGKKGAWGHAIGGMGAITQAMAEACKAAAEHHQCGIVIAPTLDYMDQAYRDAKADGWSKKPIVEMLIPSTLDDSLAPPGQHVASLFCQQFAPTLPDGRSWDDNREAAADLIIDTVNAWAPNFKASILARTILSPLDLERKLGLSGGDIMHGNMSLDQLWAARPVLGHASHRAPIKGLYMCGAGTHPGGGVSGNPGRNAAREILRDHSLGRAIGLSLQGR